MSQYSDGSTALIILVLWLLGFIGWCMNIYALIHSGVIEGGS